MSQRRAFLREPRAEYRHGVQRSELDVLVICHGGPIAMPEDAEYILHRTKNVHGFYGASSMERLPVETAITDQVKQFKEIRIKK